MNYTSLFKKTRGFILVSALLLTGAGCTLQSATTVNKPTTPVVAQTTVDFYVPKDIAAYMRAAALYSQTGAGTNPALTVVYVKKTTSTNASVTPMQTAVQAALSVLPAGGGPAHESVVYFKVVGTTAYVMLDMDFDAWAGSSAVAAALHPVIEKNLLQFSSISKVVFGHAPGDTRDGIMKTLNLNP